MLGSTPGTTKSTPSVLGQNFDSLIHEWKLVQHPEICLLKDLATAGAYFSFHLTFKIIVFLSRCYRHKMEYNCCRVSISVFGFSSRKVPQRDLSMAGCLCDSSCGILRRTTGKIFLTFQSFSLRVLPPAANKWNSAAIKILLLFEPVLFIWFGSRKASLRDFNESESWARRILQQSRGKVFFTSLNRFQELHTRLAWVIITVFASF